MIKDLSTRIIEVFKKELEKIAQEEIEQAKKRVEERIQDSVARIGLTLHKQIAMDFLREKIIISIRKDFKD